ncbi:helix-turn-helix transcriptional regulator [Chitinophaga ginsengisoli]|uniref:AraC-like DNA-binding protein n=1 Tax=Chitinophaga ginsengisoli TaxID=363837 RepID=A0A2P8GPK8_9BACT|nr:AraC family transcriptional regulator [Chitinophaga ginsengisoli]PSL35902.1 AraC-like DNA-binding protein [Chitinophaga ginsengisoli]
MEEQKEPEQFSIERLIAIPRGVMHEYNIPLRDRQGHIKLAITDSAGIVDGTMIAEKSVQPLSHYNGTAFVEMNFMLEGNISQTYDGLLTKHHYNKGYHNILFNPYSTETNQLMTTGRHRIFSIHLLPERMADLLRDYLPEFHSLANKIEKGERFVMHAPANSMDHRLKYLLHTFWDSPLQSGLGKLYFDSRILELFSRQFEILAGPIKKIPEIGKADLERLYYVKELILNNLETPPSLKSLSDQSGLTELKLKKQFKMVFNQSIYGFLCDERLRRARQMILEGEKNISTIAYELGYAHPQHFHRAFKKQFGVTPKSLLR